VQEADMSDRTVVEVPGWAKGLGKYLLGVLPILLGAYVTFHDMGQDITSHKSQILELREKVSLLKEKDHADDLVQTKVATDLEYIRETMDRIEKTMDRLATQ
jgi:uncharacterized protein YjgD (DUF1641 family)